MVFIFRFIIVVALVKCFVCAFMHVYDHLIDDQSVPQCETAYSTVSAWLRLVMVTPCQFRVAHTHVFMCCHNWSFVS